MATYPAVTAAERDAAIARIARNHRNDSRWSEAGADSDTAARDVLAYLRRSHVRTKWERAADDVWDELILSAWLYWDERRREQELLRRARHHGLGLSEIGGFLGIGTRQGTRDYLDRLDALLAEYTSAHPATTYPAAAAASRRGRRPVRNVAASYVGTTRAARGADARSRREQRTARRRRPGRQEWIETNHERITTVVAALLAQAARIGLGGPSEGDEAADADLTDYLDWLRPAVASTPARLTEATLSSLGLALGELRGHPAVTGLAANHGLRLAMTSAELLRAAYAELTTPTGPPPSAGRPPRSDPPGELRPGGRRPAPPAGLPSEARPTSAQPHHTVPSGGRGSNRRKMGGYASVGS
jgi:hypothetical protein